MKEIAIPIGVGSFRVAVGWLDSYTTGGLSASRPPIVFLNTVRLPGLPPDIMERLESEYAAALPSLLHQYDDMISTLPAPACIIGAPSSKPYVAPYLAIAKKRFPDATDLSSCFQKAKASQAGTAATYDEYRASVTFSSDGTLARYASILIVDDIFATGKTAGAILDQLRAASVDFDEVVVAVALNMNIELVDHNA